MKVPNTFIFVIFGGSGDLAERKLVPALYNLFENKLLPQRFAVIGLGRKPFNDQTYQQKLADGIEKFVEKSRISSRDVSRFIKHIYYLPFDINREESYANLKKHLLDLDSKIGTNGNFLYYLATPPEFFKSITSGLHAQKLHSEANNNWRRIIIEKPFGHDFDSAHDLNKHLLKFFHEDQIYRIDHFLGKETVQNILAFRFANGIFEPLWNRNYISHVEITAAENIGIGDRGGYYDSSGAMRDMVQNHLMQLAAIIAMEPPTIFEDKTVRDEKHKVFQSIRKPDPAAIDAYVVRGQYIGSFIRGKKVRGYREENKVAADSQTETFVAMKFFIDNWRWADVPFLIRTGKRLPTRVSEVVIHFKKTPYQMFKAYSEEIIPDNQLVLRIQPDEGILLKFGMKVPGAGFQIKNVSMDFHYADLANTKIPEAYERLILDALNGDSTLFARADSVEVAWKIVDPILNVWKNEAGIKLYGYPAGTWGPKEARRLFEQAEQDWRYPCKNLTGEDTYCEL
jgi:glucose-6-phosphate 1-dehydrogenase